MLNCQIIFMFKTLSNPFTKTSCLENNKKEIFKVSFIGKIIKKRVTTQEILYYRKEKNEERYL